MTESTTDTESVVERAARKSNVIGFNTATDALFIDYSESRNCIAWTNSDGESRMVNQNIGYRGTGSWGESNVFTGERCDELLDKARDLSIIDKAPYNYIRRPIKNEYGLNVGTAWALVVHFNHVDDIVTARERRLQSVPGVGERKARKIRRALAQVPQWSELDKE